MAKGRKPGTAKPKAVEKVVEDQVTDAVTVKVEPQTEDDIVVEQPKEENTLFMMNISEFGVKQDEAEKFVKSAIRFYFENKDKKLFEESEVKQVVVSESNDGRFDHVLEKIKRFEDQIKNNQFIPKRTVIDFLKYLKS
jgi:hypothetical protein